MRATRGRKKNNMIKNRCLHTCSLALAIIFYSPFNAVAQRDDILASAERMESRIQALSRFGANPEGGVSRIAFSEADLEGRRYITDLMQDAGLDVRVDTAGKSRRWDASRHFPVRRMSYPVWLS
jgi:hypothetical protein